MDMSSWFVLPVVITMDLCHNCHGALPLYPFTLHKAPKPAWSHRFTTLFHDMIALTLVETDSSALEICRIVEGPDKGTSYLSTIVALFRGHLSVLLTVCGSVPAWLPRG